MLTPTMYLRFVKRRVGANVVRILQQKWEGDDILAEPVTVWQDVPMDNDEPTKRDFPPAKD